MASGGKNNVLDVYRSIISDVVGNVREAFLDDGADDHALAELKSLWESKVRATGAVDWDGTGAAAAAAAAAARNEEEAVPSHSRPAPSHPGGRGEKRELAYQAQEQAASVLVHNPGPAIGAGQHIPLTPAASAVQTLQLQQAAALRQHHQVIQSQMMGNATTHYVNVPGRGVIQVMQGAGQPILTANGIPIPTIPAAHIVSKLDAHHGRQPPQLDGADEGSSSGVSPTVGQLDGATGGSEDEDSDADDLLDVEDEPGAGKVAGDEEDEDKEEETDMGEPAPEDGDPLNSDDDEPDEDEDDALFDSDNTIVCQYDKVQRVKNKWKFVLKDGVMNIDGRDYIFSKATGEAEW